MDDGTGLARERVERADERAAATTRAPRPARRSVSARPMPADAPVTTTDLPASSTRQRLTNANAPLNPPRRALTSAARDG